VLVRRGTLGYRAHCVAGHADGGVAGREPEPQRPETPELLHGDHLPGFAVVLTPDPVSDAAVHLVTPSEQFRLRLAVAGAHDGDVVVHEELVILLQDCFRELLRKLYDCLVVFLVVSRFESGSHRFDAEYLQ
jgi:hypothetical protein